MKKGEIKSAYDISKLIIRNILRIPSVAGAVVGSAVVVIVAGVVVAVSSWNEEMEKMFVIFWKDLVNI